MVSNHQSSYTWTGCCALNDRGSHYLIWVILKATNSSRNLNLVDKRCMINENHFLKIGSKYQMFNILQLDGIITWSQKYAHHTVHHFCDRCLLRMPKICGLALTSWFKLGKKIKLLYYISWLGLGQVQRKCNILMCSFNVRKEGTGMCLDCGFYFLAHRGGWKGCGVPK